MSRDLLSIEYEDDDKDYEGFVKQVNYDTERKKSIFVREIEMMGDSLVEEKRRREIRNKKKARKLIPYILRHDDGGQTFDELMDYSYEDILRMYNEIKTVRRSRIFDIVKFFLTKT